MRTIIFRCYIILGHFQCILVKFVFLIFIYDLGKWQENVSQDFQLPSIERSLDVNAMPLANFAKEEGAGLLDCRESVFWLTE